MTDKPRRLIYNALQTPDGTILESRTRHDFQVYEDDNGKVYMVDGGRDYIRRSNNGDEEDLSLYDDSPHEVQRKVLKWGSYGEDGDEALHYIPVKDMTTEHIEVVLLTQSPTEVLKACLRKEWDSRQ